MIVNLIRVTLAYRGAFEIPQGDYAADDPALHDMAEYLVRMGHARIVGQVEREGATVVPPPAVEVSTNVESPAPKPAAPKSTPQRRKRRT